MKRTSSSLRCIVWQVVVVISCVGFGCGSSSGNNLPGDASVSAETQPMSGMDMDGMNMGGMDMGALISCENDPRVTAYSANMVKTGQAGVARVKLVSANPSPPASGENSWSIQLLDSAGNPLSGAIVVALPYMPDHGHSSPQTPAVTAGASPGSFTVDNLDLFMAGVWQFQISVFPSGETDGGSTPLDIVTFFFCIEG